MRFSSSWNWVFERVAQFKRLIDQQSWEISKGIVRRDQNA